ncbi:TPA: hypothetical protein ACYERP_003391 [Klebsiella pneumoniae]
MSDITELAQSLKAAANTTADAIDRLKAFPGDELIDLSQHEGEQVDIDITTLNEWYELSSPANILALVEALEKAQTENELARGQLFIAQRTLLNQQRKIAELESRTFTAPQSDYFASLVALARVSADKAMKKFPQPNYVLLKVAEEAGEVVQASVHYAENRMEWKQVEGEIVQLLAMLIRLVTEGDQINGVTPPASCAAGIKVEAE